MDGDGDGDGDGGDMVRVRFRGGEEFLAHPTLPQHVLDEAMPGSIRNANHFLRYLKRIVEYLRRRLRTQEAQNSSLIKFRVDLLQVSCWRVCSRLSPLNCR
jgi:DNA excision repair protein ERCC-2